MRAIIAFAAVVAVVWAVRPRRQALLVGLTLTLAVVGVLVWRFAPSMAHPMGMPWRSDATDHFQPSLARSVGFGPVPSPP